MNVSIAIQTHPNRESMARALAGRIGGEIVVDPDPSGPRSAWRTYRRCLETTPIDATHRLIVQDDAVVCRDFSIAARNAIAAQPDRVLLFFVGGSPRRYADAVMKACERDDLFVELDAKHWCPVVATAWPRRLISTLIEYDDSNRNRFVLADDEICGRFLREVDEHPVATVPSLVEHPDEVKSLVGILATHGQDPNRMAACWIGSCDDGCEPASIDWPTEAVARWWS